MHWHRIIDFAVLIGLIYINPVFGEDNNDPEQENGKYSAKYDHIDIDAVIQNERLLIGYVGCLLDQKPCTPDANELKNNLPDALQTECSHCTENQKRMADKLAHHLIDNRPDDWKLLEERYDPTGMYRERYLDSIGTTNTLADEASPENTEAARK